MHFHLVIPFFWDPFVTMFITEDYTHVRCAKEVVQVDLMDCLRWHPFLEVCLFILCFDCLY